MITLRSSVCIDASAPEVWARLAKLEDIQLWSEAMVDARCAEGRESGVGAVQPEGERTRLVSQAQVVLTGGRLGRLLEPRVSLQIKRMGRRSLAAFKYLVEHGAPPCVPHARLAPAPSAC